MEIPHQPSQVKVLVFGSNLPPTTTWTIKNKEKKWKQSKNTFAWASLGLQHPAHPAERPATSILADPLSLL